jgi:hypothetical protein
MPERLIIVTEGVSALVDARADEERGRRGQ